MKHAKLRELCMLALCAPIIIVGKHALQMIPNVEVVTFFIILFTLIFGWKTLFPVGIFVLEQGLVYGFNPSWYLFYCIVWPLLSILTLLLKPLLKDNALAWAIFSSVIFVPLFSGTNILLLRWVWGESFRGSVIWAYIVAEIPYDVAHIVGNFVVCLALFTPLYRVLERLMQSTDAPLPD